MCVCLICKDVKLRFRFSLVMQGAVAPLQVYCQRRHLQLVVIPDLISLAYLLTFRNGKRLNPRTSMSSFSNLQFAALFVVAIWN